MAELAGKRVINKNKTEQRFNLKELLGSKPTESQKQLFAELAIDLIDNRTLDGKDINGKKFTKYSKAYAELKGVTRSSVDMFLEGDMLDSMDEIARTANTVTVGITGDTNSKKSDNHNNGVTLPKREFFGITKKEARKLAKEVKRVEPSASIPASRTSQVDSASISLSELRSALSLLDIEQVE